MAAQCGITDEQLAELHRWRDSEAFSAEQREVLAMTDELTDGLDVVRRRVGTARRPLPTGRAGRAGADRRLLRRACRARCGRLRLPVDPDDPALASF